MLRPRKEAIMVSAGAHPFAASGRVHLDVGWRQLALVPQPEKALIEFMDQPADLGGIISNFPTARPGGCKGEVGQDLISGRGGAGRA